MEYDEKNTARGLLQKYCSKMYLKTQKATIYDQRNKKKKYCRLYKQNIHNKNHYTKYTKAQNQVRNLTGMQFEQHEEAIAATSKSNPKRFCMPQPISLADTQLLDLKTMTV